MVAADLVTLFFWLAVIFAAFTILAALGEYIDHRDKQRQRRREREALRRHRAYMDSLPPKPWNGRRAA